MKDNILGIFFALFGGIFLAVGIVICMTTFDPNNVKIDTTAVITEITTRRDSDGDTHYDVFVEYDVDGKRYESELNFYSSGYYEGKAIDIYYLEKNPNEVGTHSGDYMVFMFPAFGLLFFSIGIGIVISNIAKKINNKKLKENGTCVYATYTETVYNTSYTVNGRSPYYIVCSWTNPSDGKMYMFKSNNVWFNPEPLIRQSNVTTFPVYIDETNPKKYFLDVDAINNNVVVM